MKNKIHKILGLGLTLVLALALVAGFAVPVAAAETINEWYEFDYPAAGEAGDWFRQGIEGEVIDAVGPMAEAINGDLYAYVKLGISSTDNLFKSEDGGRTWAETEYAADTAGGAIVDMVCSSIDEDIIYVTDGNYVYKSTDAGDEFAFVAQDSLEEAVMGDCGIDIVDEPITCIDVGYDDDDNPFVFIGTAENGSGSVYWIGEAGYPAEWADLDLSCYSTGNYSAYAVGCAPDFADSKETYAVVSRIASLGAPITGDTAVWSDVTAQSGNYSAKLTKGTGAYGSAYVEFIPQSGLTVSDLQDAITAIAPEWSFWHWLQNTGLTYGPQFELRFEDPNSTGWLEITAVGLQGYTGTEAWVKETLAAATPAGYGGNTPNGFSVFDWSLTNDLTNIETDMAVLFEAAEAGSGADTADYVLTRVRTELWEALNHYCYIDDVTIDGTLFTLPGDTHVVSTIGYPCSWNEFAELFRDCDDGNPFSTQLASRIGFPDDYEDTETLFVGVVDDGFTIGGDVYSVTSGGSVDRNVEGISAGCIGLQPRTNIISLDIYGDTDEAALIAGAYNDTNVYYSTDGGWDWDISEKDPTGINKTYVLWYEGSALAATAGAECAVSLSCGDEVGEYWNQISLIATDIDEVLDISHSPGYVCEDSETLFMLTDDAQEESVFRYDGTYWERVYCSTIAGADETPDFEWVLVSPDFNDTNAVFVANTGFELWRSLDAGCSWKKFTFPCVTRPTISAWVVIDEDTVITGGAGDDLVYKTTRHGARPWDEYDLPAVAGYAKSFDLEPGYEDPCTIILGDDSSQVFISEDGGEEWDLVGDCATALGTGDTSVVFDPAYATSDIIYAAAGDVIARCVIDWDEDMADQVWDKIYTSHGDDYWGMVAAGDTALYVADKAEVDVLEIGASPEDEDGGVLRSLNPDADDADDVVFERITTKLDEGVTELRGLRLTCDVSDDGCAENVLWSLEQLQATTENVWTYEDTLAAPVVLDTPVEGQKLTTANSATLSWNELCGADCYEVSLYQYCPECPEEKVEVDISDLMDCHECGVNNVCYECTTDICIVVDGLESGTKYYWKVRVCIGEPYLSKWSEERTFTTALVKVVDLCSPVCGGQDIILTPNFSWDEVDGATGYNIQLATTETFTAGVIRGSSTVNAWVAPAPLEYATTYYWRVRAEKDGVYSAWSVCIFTTIEEPVPAPPPVVVEPTPPAPVVPTPIIELPPTPSWVWAIIGIGTALVVVVIVLTVRTRRPPA